MIMKSCSDERAASDSLFGLGQSSAIYSRPFGEQGKGRGANLSVKEERREAVGGFYEPCQGMGGQK